MVAGSRVRWLSVPSSSRVMCGTASPIKATGPQKAVVMAVRMPVTINSQLRVRTMLMPRFSAYWSPSIRAFSGLISSSAPISPAMVTVANTGIVCIDTPPNDPMPHTIYDFTPSSVAKKFSSEMAEFEI